MSVIADPLFPDPLFPDPLFPGFETGRVVNGPAEIFYRAGGPADGAPVFLLHGFPQTGAMWARVALRLAMRFRVIVPDLRGYGASRGPVGQEHYAKRRMAGDVLAVADALGIARFDLAGHDRGGRVSYRLALDLVAEGRAERLGKLAVLDILPTLDYWRRTGEIGFGMKVYHWFFLAQPYPLPERLIGAAPDFYVEDKLSRWSGRDDLSAFEPAALEAYRANARDPETLRAMCDDYRAGALEDVAEDAADESAGRKIAAPTLALWGGAGIAQKAGAEGPLAVWRRWCDQVEGRALDCGHFLPEERPEETAEALETFFGA
ncbi:MAG: alpha/beta hydrolase [Pseudomonadota bacterium]